MTTNPFRADFPIFTQHPDLHYLDSAASSQTPQSVIDATTAYYTSYRSNTHRGLYQLSEQATTAYESSRHRIAHYFNAHADEEIIFTKGSTGALNDLARTLCSQLTPDSEIIISAAEHHSNLLPWQQAAKQYQLVLKIIPILSSGELDLDQYEHLLSAKTKLVAVTQASNVLGTINPIAAICAAAHRVGALVIVDACQSAPHMRIDVRQLDCDFLVCSGHKIYGPTGIGILYGKQALLESLPPFEYGGHMVAHATFEDATWADIPDRFEAGTSNIAGAIGLGSAIDYLQSAFDQGLAEHEQALTSYAMAQLHTVPGVVIYGPQAAGQRLGIISFNLSTIHSHDVSHVLGIDSIAVRGGHHCTMPLHQLLGIKSSVRISTGCYTTTNDIDSLITSLHKTLQLFHP